VRGGERRTLAATPGTWRENASYCPPVRDPMMRRDRAAFAGRVPPICDEEARLWRDGVELASVAARPTVGPLDVEHSPEMRGPPHQLPCSKPVAHPCPVMAGTSQSGPWSGRRDARGTADVLYAFAEGRHRPLAALVRLLLPEVSRRSSGRSAARI